jgi:hypothetical protein
MGKQTQDEMLVRSNELLVVNRMSTMRASISVAIAGLLCFSSHVAAQPNKELNELQERCGKRAAEVFEREYSPRIANTKDVQMRYNYENHYSARLNKCFFLEIAVSYEREDGTSSKLMRLFDLNDNREYGVFVSGLSDKGPPVACLLQDKICQSEGEWRQLLKPFMEG